MEVLLALLAIMGAFYFILLRPVLAQQKKRKGDISSLNVGDEVLTGGGFYATVREIRTTDEGPMEIMLEAAPGVTLRATPEAVLEITRRVDDAVPAEQADRA
ncbi:MAG TPA: preprotein translocase subunit YajC [Dehalococcoidia bacterium]|nr:preprotein translocase subunit YajC [Dehalococcoidia bacterium]